MNFERHLICLKVSKGQVLEVLKAEGAVSAALEALSVARKQITTISGDVKTQRHRTQPNSEDQIFVVVFTS